MFRAIALCGSTALLVAALGTSGCGKMKPDTPSETAQIRSDAKRHKAACASTAAYDRMKRVIFSQAGARPGSDPTNLQTLAEFSFVRMEDPVVVSWQPALDLTGCRGRFILDVPPGSERALGGERRLQADVTYTAQGAADASGLVYAIQGAEPIVGKLAAFHLAGAAYRPLPAVDPGSAPTDVAELGDVGRGTPVRRGREEPYGITPSAAARTDQLAAGAVPRPSEQLPRPAGEARKPASRPEKSRSDALAEATVRTFYNALGAGNGETASAQVVPAKRSNRAYSPDAITRFYGRLPDPLRLTGISALSDDSYRVTYRYAAPGLRCNGSAVVRVTSGPGRPLIRSITAGSGC